MSKEATARSAMKLALEALEEAWYHVGTFQPTEKAIDLYDEARTALREALAEQPAQQEPVAWMVDVDLANYQGQSEYRTILAWNAKPIWSGTHEINEVLKAVPLYTSPPTLSLAQRTWVNATTWRGLTDEQFQAIKDSLFRQEGWDGEGWDLALKEAIEAKLKEKNNG